MTFAVGRDFNLGARCLVKGFGADRLALVQGCGLDESALDEAQ